MSRLDFEIMQRLQRELQEKYRDRIDIRFGVELGLQLHLKERMEEYVNAWPFDYVIGSMHVIDGKDPYYDEFSFALAVVYWAAGIVTGIILLGFAEIIRLLQINATKEYKVYFDKMAFAQTMQKTAAKADTEASCNADKE